MYGLIYPPYPPRNVVKQRLHRGLVTRKKNFARGRAGAGCLKDLDLSHLDWLDLRSCKLDLDLIQLRSC